MKTMQSRRHLLRTGLLAGSGLMAAALTQGRVAAEAASGELTEGAQALVRDYMRAFSVPGFQLAFRRGSRILYDGAFGVADRATGQAVTPGSLFRIASDSKAFTAAAVFRLVEAGRLKLDDRVFAADGLLRQYADEGSPREWIHQITVHQLLTHTCGGWSNESNDPMFEERGMDHEQLIRWTLKTHPLQNPPGEKYAYSNFGYCLLGRVIEMVSGERYPESVRQEVLRPARIQDMRIGTHQTAPGEVHYYGQDGENPEGFPVARMDAHGGWIATALDMATFMACLFSPQDNEGAGPILTRDSLKRMTTGSTANPGYACGLAVNREGNAWHSGSLPGTTSLMVHTRSGLAWAAVLNTRSPEREAGQRLDRMLWEIAKGQPGWGA
ncbi:MAG: beta-lactamase family protein [Verrucomicrobia bacterium]|nr:beta-lactamase family protein [Verrucomicrobiota bacterium]